MVLSNINKQQTLRPFAALQAFSLEGLPGGWRMRPKNVPQHKALEGQGSEGRKAPPFPPPAIVNQSGWDASATTWQGMVSNQCPPHCQVSETWDRAAPQPNLGHILET